MVAATKKISQLNSGSPIQAGDFVEIERSVVGVPTTFKAALGTMASQDVASFSSSTLLADLVVSVKDPVFGAVGNGTTDDTAAIQAAIDFCFGTSGSPHGVNANLNRPLYFPAGTYKITAALVFTQVSGGIIFGAGRLASKIIQATSNINCITTNGMQYTRVENLWFEASGASARLFDLSWDGSGSIALQEVYFNNCYFDGNGTALRGLDIGRGGFMGSECIILNCYFDSCVEGVRTSNFNALQNQVIGGNFNACGTGIHVASGSIPLISNVGFQAQTTWDIKADNATRDTMTVLGCRTESLNFFAHLNNAIHTLLSGITQVGATNAVFLESDAQSKITLIGCNSEAGQIVATNPRITMHGCQFDRSSTFSTGFFNTSDYVEIWHSIIAGTEVRHRQLYFDTANGSGFLQIDWQQKKVINVTANKTLVATQSGFTFKNTGTAARVDLTLPAAAAELEYTFTVDDTDGIRIIANTGDDIRIAASVSAAAGRIDSTTIGDSVTIRGNDNTHWVAVAIVGAGWTVT